MKEQNCVYNDYSKESNHLTHNVKINEDRGLSHRCDRSYHHEWDLLWIKSPKTHLTLEAAGGR